MRALLAALGLVLAVGVPAFGMASCAQSAVNVPVRTFERAQRVDVVCMKVLDNSGSAQAAEPAPQAQCAPVPPNVDGSTLPYHLYALVTQTTRGEIAVVDLTAGLVVDGDHSTPGINFIPVGALPTDVAVAPDGQMAFVASAEVNRPALYAIASKNILGDSQGLQADATPPPPTLPALPVCALPQAPGNIAVVPRGDSYEIAVVFPGDERQSAKVVTIDPGPFLREAGLDQSDAGPDGGGDRYTAGALKPCALSASIELSGDVPAVDEGARWQDGIKYDAGAPPEPPPVGIACGGSDAGPGDAGADGSADGGAEAGPPPDAGSGMDAGAADAGVTRGRPHATVASRDGTTLYVGDDGVPLVHIVDLAQQGKPQERAPLVATSAIDPTRRIQIGDVAVSPASSDYRKYVYALDKTEGSIIVYDVTDPPTTPRAPLLRPHPELNPFQPPDRIIFNVPVAAVSFVRHDFPLTNECDNASTVIAAKTGLLCNPNPAAADPSGNGNPVNRNDDVSLGVCYRNNAPNVNQPVLGPSRLRGVFGFVTLSSGQVVSIDVDDWDAPCRRPDPMALGVAGFDFVPNAIAAPEPAPTGPTDLDPYHVPQAFVAGGQDTTPVTLESFFPVSAPHRPRSLYLLRNDATSGQHGPTLNGVPQLFNSNSALATSGAGSEKNPILLPAYSKVIDFSLFKNPTEPDPAKRAPIVDKEDAIIALSKPGTGAPPGVRFSYEDPQVHVDQDWTVTYEGALPAFDGTTLATDVETADNYQSLLLRNPNALFCRKGVEDYRVAQQRAAAVLGAMGGAKITPPADLAKKVGDYVQLADDLLDPGDPYWGEGNNDCWEPQEDTAQKRYDACQQQYGAAVDQKLSRDFPILEAYDDRLVLGRFGVPDPKNPSDRVVVGRSDTNARELRLMRCCFHHQVKFRIRTGGMWITLGSNVGYLHHVSSDDSGACTLSCEAREALLNARTVSVPWPDDTAATPPDRNSPLAMRNPAFSFVVWAAQDKSIPPRDVQWKFSTRGQFSPLVVNIASTTTAVAPQSMRFIESLGQLAVVDGSSQGLVLIDLNTVTLAHTPFF